MINIKKIINNHPSLNNYITLFEEVILDLKNKEIRLNIKKEINGSDIIYEIHYDEFYIRLSYIHTCQIVIPELSGRKVTHFPSSTMTQMRVNQKLYNELIRLYNQIDNLYSCLSKVMFNDIVIAKKREITERIEEFEIIKDNKIDIISLNSLYDFYGKEFDYKYENVFYNFNHRDGR